MDSAYQMDLYFDPTTRLLKIQMPCTGEQWIYHLQSYNPPSSSLAISPAPEPFHHSTSPLMEMIDESSPTMSSVEFFVYVDEMTGLLWINIPSSDDEPWRVYELPASEEEAYPSPMSSSQLDPSFLETTLFPPAPFEWPLFLDSTCQPLYPNSPPSSFLCIPTPPQSGIESPASIATPPDNIPLSRTLTANSNPALPIPRIPLVKPRNTPTPRREAPGNNPSGRTGVKKCGPCRDAKRACVYSTEEDVCRRCRNRDVAHQCIKEEAPERKRMRLR